MTRVKSELSSTAVVVPVDLKLDPSMQPEWNLLKNNHFAIMRLR